MIRLRLHIIAKANSGMPFFVQSLRGYIMLLYITGNDNLDHLVKVVSVRSLYCKFTILLFEITKYFWEDTWSVCKYLVSV